MRRIAPAVVGVFFFVLAGLALSVGENSVNQDLWMMAHYGLLGSGLLGVIVGGIAIGTSAISD